MRDPLISLCMIVKNEEKDLPRCLESVCGLVDEIVILDTGSEDNTVSVAESFGAKVYHMSWPGNFSAARNESVKKASGNWILYLDADEALDPNGCADCIRKAALDPAVTAWSVPIRSYQWGTDAAYSVTVNIRLFRNLPELLFENEVHERIEPALARIGAKIAPAPFCIDHFGYRVAPEAMKKKMERNLLLSQKHLQRDPHDPYCLYYMGVSLLLLQRAAESKQYFQRALLSKDLPLFLEAMTCNLAAYVELLEGRPDESLVFAKRSIDLVPLQNTAYMVSGIALFRKAEFAAALPLLARSQEFLSLQWDLRQTDLSQEHVFIDNPELHKLLGICLSEIDRPREAVEHFEHFLEPGGKDPEVARRAGVCCVNAGDFASGLKYLEEAERLGVARSELVLPMAFASMKLKDFTRAQLLLKEAEKSSSPDTDKMNQLRDLLESGSKSCCAPVQYRSDCSVPRVSLCMIAKDEQERISGCLESVCGLVDEIIVVDTGSSDRTKEIARSCGAKVFSFPWTGNFAEARNESLRYAAGDWIIFLDADERLNTFGVEDCLRKSASAQGVDAYVVPIINQRPDGKTHSTVGRAVRFFRNLPGAQFSGRVHEGVDRFLIESGVKAYHADFEILHFGYALEPDIVRMKYERNLHLLKEELAEDPANSLFRYHLGLTCMAMEREEEARQAFDLALCGTGLIPSLEAMILNMKSYHHLRAGENDQALGAASRSLSVVPIQNTALLLKGLALFRKKAHGEALPLLLQAYRFVSLPPRDRKSDISFEDSIDEIDLMEVIGICFAETGRFDEAIPFLKLTGRHKPGPAVFERLGVCLLNCGNFPAALENLKKARNGSDEPNSLALPLAFASLKTGDLAAAAEYFRRARPRDEREISLAFQMIQAMAADKAFRPFLPGCIRSKEDTFRHAFGERFLRFLSELGAPESISQNLKTSGDMS
jgi:glycosyltransferase involved in cell wall biosynthesis/Flp pilus assembly protein TadD